MTGGRSSLQSALVVAVAMLAAIATAHGQEASDFKTEPDKSMAAAHDSFVKRNMDQAARHLHNAAVYVRKQGDKVAADTKASVKQAGDDLDNLAKEVRKGTVKSADELKKTFAQVDHTLAKAWHTTAEQANKAGKDSTAALKNAGTGLENAAKWSGTKLQEGAQASVDGLKKIGKGVKLGSEQVASFFKGIGEGIADMASSVGK
jgi:hypothetical protein